LRSNSANKSAFAYGFARSDLLDDLLDRAWHHPIPIPSFPSTDRAQTAIANRSATRRSTLNQQSQAIPIAHKPPLNQPNHLHKERARQRQTLSQTDFKKLSLLTASAPPPIATDQNWRVENDHDSTVD